MLLFFARFSIIALLLLPLTSFAATQQFVDIYSILKKPGKVSEVHPYAISLSSNVVPLTKNTIARFDKITEDLIYQTHNLINNKHYYRIVTGNFSDQAAAKRRLEQLKTHFPGAWLHSRSKREINQLTQQLGLAKPMAVAPVKAKPNVKPQLPRKLVPAKPIARKPRQSNEKFAGELLEQSRQLLIDQNYPRIVALSDKVIEIGTTPQKQEAMELLGVARERQRKYAQAQQVYTEFLALYPDSEMAPRIKSRLNGLRTMGENPRDNLADDAENRRSNWKVYGSLSQYYRNDELHTDGEDSVELNSALVSDVSLFARRKTEESALVLRFDGGLINDFKDDEDDTRVSRAQVRYTNDIRGYQVTGGRQTRTAKGVFNRFDGVVFSTLNHDIDYSLYTGYPVASTYDGMETDAHFIGASANFSPMTRMDVDVYLLQQNRDDLTDRQAMGAEMQYRNDRGFFYGILDFDTFYEDLNAATAIVNYRMNDQWVLNTTYDFRNSPFLTTQNALQGQAVEDLEELSTIFSDDEIYQLAEDRTSKSQNIVVSSNYQIDDARQLYTSISLSTTEETESSGGVAESPSSDSIYLSGEYSIRNFFFEKDYSSFGLRLSDNDNSNIISFRGRTRVSGSKSLRYDPRLQLDYRHGKDSDLDQWILKPSFKLTYKPTRSLNLEGSLAIEYSDYNLPELNNQTAYSLFLGYVYQF